MFLVEFIKKIQFCKKTDRIGPDIFWTHWRLHFKSTMLKLCQQKFKHFDSTAEFRPGAYAVYCSNISIGKRVVIRPNTMLFAENGKIIIEDNVLIGSGVHFYVSHHKHSNTNTAIINQGWLNPKQVVLKEGCWVGANVTLLPGITIGRNSVIGAGAVVTGSIPDYSVAVGVPARVIKKLK